MDDICHIAVTLPLNDDPLCLEQAKKIFLQVRPDWCEEGLKLGFFTEGITNKLIYCRHDKTGKDDRVLIRIFGENSEILIDRNRMAPPVYATIDNGLVYGFVPGVCPDTKTIRDEKIATQVAKTMAQMHFQIRPDDPNELPENKLLKRMPSMIDSMPETFDDADKQALYSQLPSKTELHAQLKEIEEMMSGLQSPIVFCHNDLLLNNIVYNEKDDNAAAFIDYEYACYNYQSFDIADHFTEFAGVDDVDFSLYPDEKFQRWWLRTYLEFYHDYFNKLPPNENDVQRLYVQVNRTACVPHFFWSVWAIIQAKYSSIDFDFTKYALDRYGEYIVMKDKFADLKLTDS